MIVYRLFRPIPNFRRVLLRAYSVRLIIAAIILSALEVALPIIDQIISIPRGLFATASAVTGGGAFWARLVAQRKVHGDE
jgi:hypothetical protein